MVVGCRQSWGTAMTERRKLLLDRLSSFVLEVLPWSLSGLIGLYLLSSYVLLPVRAEGTPVSEYGNPSTPANHDPAEGCATATTRDPRQCVTIVPTLRVRAK